MSHWKFSANSYSNSKILYSELIESIEKNPPRFINLNYSKDFMSQWSKLKNSINSSTPLGVIGLGGSSLGLKAILRACWPNTLDQRVHFFDNIDPSEHHRKLKNLETPEQMNWVVISKSGRTIETLTLLESLFYYYKNDLGLDFKKNLFFVSESNENPLGELATNWKRPLFNLPKDLGGRFSVFSAVGLLPLQLLGLDTDPLVEGAEYGFQSKEIVEQLAQFILPSLDATSALYLCTYSDRLQSFKSWMNQLWSESLGKNLKRDNSPNISVGPMVPFRGATDQHSILQQSLEGSFSKKVLFLRSKDSEQSSNIEGPSLFDSIDFRASSLGQLMETEAEATIQAFDSLKIDNAVLITSEINSKSIGAAMGIFMLSIALVSEAMNINAYNQPAVEIGKNIARERLLKK